MGVSLEGTPFLWVLKGAKRATRFLGGSPSGGTFWGVSPLINPRRLASFPLLIRNIDPWPTGLVPLSRRFRIGDASLFPLFGPMQAGSLKAVASVL